MTAAATDLVLYQGVYDDLITIWDRLVDERLFFDCGASRNAYKHEGKKTLAYEIAEQSGWRVPGRGGGPPAGGRTVNAAQRRLRRLRRPRRRAATAPEGARHGRAGQPA